MNVYWREQTESDVPADSAWLNPAEVARLHAMRFPKRHADWRLGRWTAKRAVAAYLKLHPDFLSDIELRAAPDGVPEAYIADRPAPLSISLSHRGGIALCAVAPPGAALGCDLEAIEPRSEQFLADYFMPEEQALVASASAGERSRFLALLWSAKESALKALRTGLRLDTRSVIVGSVDIIHAELGRWHPLRVRCSSGQIFHGWWRQTDRLIRTLVADPCPAAPLVLEIASPSEHLA